MATTTTSVVFPAWYDEMAATLKQQGKSPIIASPDFYTGAAYAGTTAIANVAASYTTYYGLLFAGEMISEILERTGNKNLAGYFGTTSDNSSVVFPNIGDQWYQDGLEIVTQVMIDFTESANLVNSLTGSSSNSITNTVTSVFQYIAGYGSAYESKPNRFIQGNFWEGGIAVYDGSNKRDYLKPEKGMLARVYGNGGDDYITEAYQAYGGTGNDYLTNNRNAEGDDGDDYLTENSTAKGGAGKDYLTKNSTAEGGDGSDYLTNNTTAKGGNDSDWLVSNASASGEGGDDYLVDNQTASGGDGNDYIIGTSGNDDLDGNNGNDYIEGGNGNDDIDGGNDDDLLIGGAGDDEIHGGSGSDIVVFSADSDFTATRVTTTTVQNAVNWLAKQVGLKTVYENRFDITGQGTDKIHDDVETIVINTGASANKINVSAFTGTATVDAGAGNDTIETGSGNDLLAGNTGDDLLNGGSGADFLMGNEGNDTLIGGSGDDLLSDSSGNNVYVFDADSALGTDTIVESTNSGTDTVNFSDTTTQNITLDLIKTTQQTVNANLSLILQDTSGIKNAIGGSQNDNLTGNNLNNSLEGGNGNDTLSGGVGNDTVSGGAGNDVYLFDADSALGTNTIIESNNAGIDTVNFSDTTTQNITLDLSKTTQQTVANYLVKISSPTVLPSFGLIKTTQQTVDGYFSLLLNNATGIENAIGGSQNDNLTGNSLDNSLEGRDGNDILSGGAGNDTLSGSAGNDTLSGDAGNDVYLFDADSALGTDTVIESNNAGTDTVNFSDTTTQNITLDLSKTTQQTVNGNLSLLLNNATGIENAIGGSQNDNLTGNSLDNSLEGGNGNDTLSGGAGNDNLSGDFGDDVYVFDADSALGADKITEFIESGIDTVNFSDTTTQTINLDLSKTTQQTVNSNLSLTIRAPLFSTTPNVENAIGGSQNDTITGNSSNNSLEGREGNDILNGNSGDDILNGGAGNDMLIGDSGNDTMTGGAGNDVFQLSASATRRFSLSSSSVSWSTSGSDWIKDFGAGDRIQIDTNDVGMSNRSAFRFQDGKLFVGNNVLATLEGVTSFNVNNIEFI